jgi:hypothetical protein
MWSEPSSVRQLPWILKRWHRSIVSILSLKVGAPQNQSLKLTGPP